MGPRHHRCRAGRWVSRTPCGTCGIANLVLEDHPEIGTPVHCGECLSKLATEELALDLPDEVIALEVRGIRMLFPDGTSRVLSEPGYVLEKHLFERWLIAEAVAGGVEVRLGHTVTAMNRDSQLENRIGNWVLEGRGSTFPIRARSIIDASGVAGVASKLLDLSTLSRSSQDSSMSSRTLRTMATSISTSGLLTHLMGTFG